jgi:O-antigen/teichoic acid export membrane protein
VPSIPRFINLKGELFSLAFTYGLTAVIKLASSLILTRLLNPSAYGVVAILFSVAFILELVSDVGTTTLLVRHPRGSEPRFIHTIWTIRLLRSILNASVLFVLAPVIAELYGTPLLTDALRWYSVTFVLAGCESMAFILAQRDQRSRIVNYAELATNAIMTLTVIALATVYKDHYAFIYGILLQRLLMTVTSYFYYREVGVAIAFDRDAMVEQFKFARVVLPSSLLTIVLSQYDKIALLKLFDLSLLGIYGVAGGMIAPVNTLISKNCRVVLYARCSEYFRSDRASVVSRYYGENKRLLAMGTLLPAAVAGLSQSIVALLYDSRYAQAGTVLMVLGLVSVVGSFEHPIENLLVASGRIHMVLMGNMVRLVTLPGFSLLGYYLYGFNGFLWGGLAGTLIVLAYFFWEQRRWGMLNAAAEWVRLGWAALVFGVCLAISRTLLHFLPTGLLLPGLRGH